MICERLERVSKPCAQGTKADDGACQSSEGEVNVGPSLVSDSEAAEAREPRKGALDDPSMPTEVAAAFDAFSSDPVLDAAFRACPAAAGVVIALVCVQFSGPLTRPAALAVNGRNGIEQRLEHLAVVDVGAAEAHR